MGSKRHVHIQHYLLIKYSQYSTGAKKTNDPPRCNEPVKTYDVKWDSSRQNNNNNDAASSCDIDVLTLHPDFVGTKGKKTVTL